MANETYNILQGIFNGQTPIQRSNPMSGESNYYYMKPNQNSYTPLSQMQTVDVPSATTPNPYLREGYGNSYSKNSFEDYSAENTTDKNLTDKRVENIMGAIDQYPTLKKAADENGGLTSDDIRRLAVRTHFLNDGSDVYNIGMDFLKYRFNPLYNGLSDKYRHAMINCRAAQRGIKGVVRADFLSRLKEKN